MQLADALWPHVGDGVGLEAGQHTEAVQDGALAGLGEDDQLGPAIGWVRCTRDGGWAGTSATRFPRGFPSAAHQSDQDGDVPVVFDGVAQGLVELHSVDVATPIADVRQVARLLELGDDVLDGALRDADPERQVSNAGIRILRNANEDMRVVRQKGPAGGGPSGRHGWLFAGRLAGRFARGHGLTLAKHELCFVCHDTRYGLRKKLGSRQGGNPVQNGSGPAWPGGERLGEGRVNRPETIGPVGLGALAGVHGALDPVERLRRLAGLERGDLGVVIVYAVAIGLVSLAVPIAAQALVNTVAFAALLQPLVVLSTLVLVGLLAAGVLRALQYRVVETLQERIFVRTTHEVVLRLVRADAGTLSRRAAQELVNRFFDVAVVQKAASTLLLDGLSIVLQSAVSLVLLAFYHPALLAFDVVLVAIIAFILFGLGRGGIESAIEESRAKYQTGAWLEDVAGALRAFKSKESSEFAFIKSDQLARTYVLSRRKHFRVLFRQVVSSYLLQALATAVLLGLGGALVIRGQLTLGQLVAAELVVTGVLAGVSKFGKYLENFYDLAAAIDKVGALVDLPQERTDGVENPHREHPAHLSVERVTFSYDGKRDVVRELSFELEPGARRAIFGDDAGGKTTLVDLLYAVRAPSSGSIKLDGVDFRTQRLVDLRRDIMIVGALEIVDGTVLDNVRLGRDEVDARTIAEVLDAVGLSEELGQLPAGSLTEVGSRGVRLTSSQAVRVMIARALVCQPRLLVLDEALDGLGTETARNVIDGLAALRYKTTLLVLTSREEIAALVGNVICLERGSAEVHYPGAVGQVS
jgi:putative ABC transport system ATP-binding protein